MVKVDEKEYMLNFFRDYGFARKRCPHCGAYYWTRNEKQEHCGDTPCTTYYFSEIEAKKPLTVSEARKAFITFFEKHGHKPVRPRPVVARWREDLYLTIASIVVFQPHVTEGIVEPPANPLVIVQPCIRLEDIDNVGVTIGRHLTSFEMGGHHAFNYPDKEVYWKEETVELAYKFFTQELGIPEDQVSFKESWWEGGGNAGPSFEVTVGGLELATLVFMQFRCTDKGYEPMKLRVVDTGYGVERIAWFTQKTLTAFHAVYGTLVDKFREILGLPEPDTKLLSIAQKYAGLIDPDKPDTLAKFYELIAHETSTTARSVREVLEREAKLYALLDHTRTLALMLADGVVPSNTGEGYLARLVTRRSLRILWRLKPSIRLSELVKLQIDYWSQDYYPQLATRRDYILEIVDLEEERFRQSLERARRAVERTIRKKRKISLDELIEFYDSQGIPPEDVAEIASKYGIKVEVPHNFYSLVAARHRAPARLGKQVETVKAPQDIVEWASKLPPTRTLFHENPYQREFTAKPVGVKGKYLVLDKTAFYPTGGGQQHDTGFIECNGERYQVVDVFKVGNVVVHVLDRDMEKSCQEVRGVIDWERRYKLMIHHDAVHILLGALRRVLGDHVWQAGAEKTPEKARLDVTHYKLPTREEVKKIEELVNKVIAEARPIKSVFMHKNEAEERYGYVIYQGGVPLEPQLRIVEIEGWDVEACYGTHTRNTMEVGAVKIINVEKIQDGVIRFEIVAGPNVASYAAKLEDKLATLAHKLNTSIEEIEARLEKFVSDARETRQRLTAYRTAIKNILLDNVKDKATLIRDVKVYTIKLPVADRDLALELLKTLTSQPKTIAIAGYDTKDKRVIEVASSSDVPANLAELRKLLPPQEYKGGGRGTRATYITKKQLDEALKDIMEAVKQLVEHQEKIEA